MSIQSLTLTDIIAKAKALHVEIKKTNAQHVKSLDAGLKKMKAGLSEAGKQEKKLQHVEAVATKKLKHLAQKYRKAWK